MKGVRFYVECGEESPIGKRNTVRQIWDRANEGWQINCVALFTEPDRWRHNGGNIEALLATFYYKNSDVSLGSVSRVYLQRKCKRVPEALARKLHPRLFERLDHE
ncbi:MAG TPA: hypothetical protein VF748_14615 [Candidatus Acidoferrum sp.]